MPDARCNTAGLGAGMEPNTLQVRLYQLHYTRSEGQSFRSCLLIPLEYACIFVYCRAPGEDKVSEEWCAALEVARQGQIAKLNMLTLDVIMAPKDGVDRYLLPSFSEQSQRQEKRTLVFSYMPHLQDAAV